MKVLVLADPGSSHTIKWSRALAKEGIIVHIMGLSHYQDSSYHGTGIEIETLALPSTQFSDSAAQVSKSKYLKLLPQIKRKIKSFKPDILHAHYASSYGLLGALTKFHPYIISVWGSDVYEFGQKNLLNRSILKFNFRRADMVMSTSRNMADQTRKYTNKEIVITPFGVDTNVFYPSDIRQPRPVTLGMVKSMEEAYGIDIAIQTLAELKDKSIRLRLVGDGSRIKLYKKLAAQLRLENRVDFVGRVDNNQVPFELHQMDIYIAPSRAESFGVSIIEASACGLPVVTSNVGGLPEVVLDNQSGYIVDLNDTASIVRKLDALASDVELRSKMGKKGRAFILENYAWDDAVQNMINAYNRILCAK